jgi:pimeloyl-ACP methyl ester carboxylesterase
MVETMNPVDVGEVSLGVVDTGFGSPVVFVHGFPELAFSWRYQMPALAGAGFRAIAYDQRSYGTSDKPPEIDAYGIESLVSDLTGLLDALGLERASLVGHDWGSIVVWSAAVMAPERVDRVVSLNGPYRGWCAGFPPIAFIRENLADRFGYVLSFQEPGVDEARFAADPDRWLRRIYSSLAKNPEFLSAGEFEVYRDAFASEGIAGALNYYRNIDANFEATTPLADAEIRHPALMVVADSDPVLPATLADGMERWVPALRTELIADCGHWTQQEQPAAVNRLLIDFLGEGS